VIDLGNVSNLLNIVESTIMIVLALSKRRTQK
jgi:hypothetical protein